MSNHAPRKTIDLDRPILGHHEPIRRIVLREPAWDEVMAYGHPYQVHYSPEGARIVVENHEAVRAYAEACVVEPDSLLLTQLGLHDSLKVRGAIFDFFLSAGPGDAASNTSPANSSSSPNSSPTPSGA